MMLKPTDMTVSKQILNRNRKKKKGWKPNIK